jgi:23S rRNA (cytosine1962-C5)-methyltransferase
MLHLFLKKDRDAPVRRRHPWIFSGAIERTEGDEEARGVVDVFDRKSNWLARGLYNPKTQLRVRLLTWRKEAIDQSFFLRRLSQGLALRTEQLAGFTNAYRMINGEGDFLPGLIIDRYADYFVCQFLTAGMDGFKADIVAALSDLSNAKGVFERSEGRVREEEGIEPRIGVLVGESPPDTIEINERGNKFLVDVKRGQKTGFFLDQRDSRAFFATLARDRTVLDCFAYTGGFSVYALTGGAKEVTTFDSSYPALELAERNLELNGYSEREGDLIKGDAFAYLKELDHNFDLIVLDPPSLAHKRGDIDSATGGYKFLNLHALKHLQAGGFLLTFSCSQHMSADLFQKVVFGAAVDAGREVTIVKRLGHPVDHPVSLYHPEGEYLRGLVLRVVD